MKRKPILSLCLSLAIVLSMSGSDRLIAGWITIKNETGQTIIIQETSLFNGILRRSKPIKLVPGEVFREYQANAGQKNVSVLESGILMNRLLCKGELEWQQADKSFSIVKSPEKISLMTTEEAIALANIATATTRAQAPMSSEKKPK